MFSRRIERLMERHQASIDRALRASDERHQAFTHELEERRERFDREMEQRYRDEVQVTREVIRRNELVMSRLVEKVEQLTEDSKAQTRAILQVLDRFQNGGGEAAAS